jgi:hypothetical protein
MAITRRNRNSTYGAHYRNPNKYSPLLNISFDAVNGRVQQTLAQSREASLPPRGLLPQALKSNRAGLDHDNRGAKPEGHFAAGSVSSSNRSGVGFRAVDRIGRPTLQPADKKPSQERQRILEPQTARTKRKKGQTVAPPIL